MNQLRDELRVYVINQLTKNPICDQSTHEQATLRWVFIMMNWPCYEFSMDHTKSWAYDEFEPIKWPFYNWFFI
jgi:hypothetical protein